MRRRAATACSTARTRARALVPDSRAPLHGETSADDAERLVEAVRRGEYSHGLGHYPADSVHERWLGLSRHITPQLLARAGVPPGTRIVPGDSELLSRDSAKQAPQQQVAPYFADAPRTPHFAPMAARRLTGMTAGEVRRASWTCVPLRVQLSTRRARRR